MGNTVRTALLPVSATNTGKPQPAVATPNGLSNSAMVEFPSKNPLSVPLAPPPAIVDTVPVVTVKSAMREFAVSATATAPLVHASPAGDENKAFVPEPSPKPAVVPSTPPPPAMDDTAQSSASAPSYAKNKKTNAATRGERERKVDAAATSDECQWRAAIATGREGGRGCTLTSAPQSTVANRGNEENRGEKR